MQEKPPLSTSEFYMWRSLLAIAWADGECGAEEIAYFAKLFDNLPRYYALTQSQRDTLAKDIEAPDDMSPETLFAHINEPGPRTTLILYAQDLVMLDGVLDAREDEILKKLRLWEQPAYDRDALRVEIRKLIADNRAASEKERQAIRTQIRGMHPLYDACDKLLIRLGIDLIE